MTRMDAVRRRLIPLLALLAGTFLPPSFRCSRRRNIVLAGR